jgi:hypothetical protein
MKLDTIEMSRPAAREAFLAYRRAVRERHDAEDEQIMRGYRELARGRMLISLSEAIRTAGADDRGRPKLAIVRAHSREVHVHVRSDGSEVTFTDDGDYWRARHRNRVTVRDAGIMPPICSRACMGVGSDHRHPLVAAAITPIVPPPLRPAAHLRNYHVLFEADWKAPPVDPALLRHIGGDLYAVLAVWDLTPVERLVLAGRS